VFVFFNHNAIQLNHFDAIVIGVGSMGAATCYHIAERGYRVLGLEQFTIPHTLGSHAGQSRIIRKAYFEHPDYVPLLQRAYRNWQKMELQTNEQVYFKTGLLYHGPANHPVIKGVLDAACMHNIEIKELTHKQSSGNYNQFMIPHNFKTVFEPEAGCIRPEKAISLYTREAIKNGAVINSNEPVITWKKRGDEIEVVTAKNSYFTEKLVITAGAWAGKMISSLIDKLKISRQMILWVKPTEQKIFSLHNFHCWLIADDKRPGALYGFPYLNEKDFGEPEGLKFAWHFAAEETDPDNVNRDIKVEEIRQLINHVSEYIPSVADAEIVAAKTCLYSNTPDENFIIDHLPGYESKVTIACGFSGHGFKFVSVMGEILADLAIDGKTALPIEFLSLKRFSK
ncbi:MAG: N-methyl-L-tryptophan oxidase, partial [Chitinophagaceae bacterium]